MRLIYLHRILKRHDQHWTKKAFYELDKLKIGWSKDIRETLSSYDLPNDYITIKSMTKRRWTKLVTEKTEIKNTQRLINECHKSLNGMKTPKTKTAHILESLTKDTYQRKPQEEIMHSTRQMTKTIVIARFGMLECGRNFKGSHKEICSMCNTLDDENHRMNYCRKFRNINNFDRAEKVEFTEVYSDNVTTLMSVISSIERVWNTQTAHGTMRNQSM